MQATLFYSKHDIMAKLKLLYRLFVSNTLRHKTLLALRKIVL